MRETLKDWADVLAFDALKPEIMTPVSIGDLALVLYRAGDDVRAFAGKCPHKGAPMEQGVACKSPHGDVQLVCPWHKATFSAVSGRLIEPPALDPLASYPVKILDGRILVGKVPMTQVKPLPMRHEETVAIIGAGAGAIAATVTLREEGFEGRILLISPEPDAPYDRTALSKVTLGSGDAGPPPLLREASWYATHRVERIQDRVVALRPDKREMVLEAQGVMTATHILLASGSSAKTLDLPGSDLECVHTLRSAADLRAILGDLEERTSAVVIGSGFVGMEAAAALRKQGARVAVVSNTALPFNRQFGSDIATQIRSLHEGKGVAFIPSCAVTRLKGERHVAEVELEDGTILSASLVLVAVGSAPVLDYLKDVPLNENGGVDVDATMCVAPNIYAAGDIASVEHKGVRYRIEHWRTAQCQARIAARAMLGLPVGELPVPWFWTQQYDRKIEYLGWPQPYDSVEIEGEVERFDFTARFVRDGKIVALATAGRPKAMGEAAVIFDDA